MAKDKADKDPFSAVPEEFKEAVVGMSAEEIDARIAKVAKDQVELMRAKKEDQDLEEKKVSYREAGLVYREGSKLNRVKIEYCKSILEQKGGN